MSRGRGAPARGGPHPAPADVVDPDPGSGLPLPETAAPDPGTAPPLPDTDPRPDPVAAADAVVPGLELPDGVRAVVGALPGAALVLGPGGSVLLANRAAERLRLVLLGRLQVDELAEPARLVLADGAPRDVAVRAGWRGRNRPDGGGGSLAARVRLLPDPDGRPLALLLVEDRTAQLRVEAARQDFVVNVSHELKTPVGALALLAEATRQAADDPVAVVRFAGRMEAEAARLAALVAEIVQLSRVQLHDPAPTAVRVPVDQLVGLVFDRSRTDAEAKRIALVSAVPAGLAVVGDRGDLVSALGNLVSNALAYSPSHTRVTVAASTVPRPGHPDWVEIAVSDQGIGIPADKQGRIFERFFRLDEARSRATGGTGLGLAIVKHVASGHGGSVRVWSVPGAGSTFTLRLPGSPAEGST